MMRLSTSTNILSERCDGIDIVQNDVIRLCAEAGYRTMDFCFHDIAAPGKALYGGEWAAYMDSVAQTAATCGIEWNQGHAVVYDFCNPKEQHEHKRLLMERCILGAKMLGIPWLVVHPSTMAQSPQPYKDSKAANIDYLSGLVDEASRQGVGIAVENMWDAHLAPRRAYATNAEELIELVEAVPGMGICWDAEHGSIMRQDQVQAIRLIGKHLVGTHISDQTGLDNFHVLPYLGITHWEDVLGALAAADYQGDLTFEIQHAFWQVPQALLPASVQYSVRIGEYMVERFCQVRGVVC